MRPPVSKQYFELPDGLWGLADLVMHFEALIAQHPNDVQREALMVRYKALEHALAISLLASYAEFEQVVDAALQHGATGAGDDAR